MNEYGLKDIESDEQLALLGLDVSARISGLLVETSLTQNYRNDTETNLELAYTFPLPVGATLLSFSVNIGNRSYHGEVVARAKAEIEYEKAISEGNSAFRLQEIRSGLYNATLGNVMPGESITLTVIYAETLAWIGNCLRYRLPTTIAPRYGEPTRMQPWQHPETSMSAEYGLSLTVSIAGELARSAISCPSHKVSFLPETDSLKVKLARNATMDRDFILEIECTAVQSLAISAFSRNTHVTMLTLLPSAVDHNEQQRDVVMILDCSGSMQGDSLRLAEEGILLALGSMQPNERFGIVAFGSHAITFDKQLQPANRKNIDMARHWIHSLDTMGGTNLFGAMELALTLIGREGTDILLLTDGEVWLDDETQRTIKEKGTRIFTVGIGSAVAQDVVQKLADDTGGACELVSPTEDMSARIYRHFNRMHQPKMESLALRWPLQPKWVAQPERACFAGDAYTVFAAFDEEPYGSLSATFNFTGQPSECVEIPLMKDAAAADAIIRLAAKQHLNDMPEAERQEWAVCFQIMTEETDYLIKVERAEGEQAGEFPTLQVQPQMLPAGWGGTSTVLSSASRSDALPVVRYSRPLSLDYCSVGDVPAVFRKRSATQGDIEDNGYKTFIDRINNEARKKIFGGLPKTRSALTNLPLPDPLAEVIQEFAASSYNDDEIVSAFYRALIDHDGNDNIHEKALKKIRAILEGMPLNQELVNRLLDVLNSLWKKCPQRVVEARNDIPAFLRKQAD